MNDRERLAHIEQAARNMEGEASMIARLAAELRGRVEEQADSPIAPDVPSARPGEGLGTEGSNPSPASPVKPCPWCEGVGCYLVIHEGESFNEAYFQVQATCGARGPRSSIRAEAIEAWNRRTPAPSPATGESAIDKALDPNCWDLAMQADTLAAARAELASLRAEVERLRTALAEKEKAGVNANAVVERCIELVVRKKTPSWDEVSVWCDALRTALGAKETK